MKCDHCKKQKIWKTKQPYAYEIDQGYWVCISCYMQWRDYEMDSRQMARATWIKKGRNKKCWAAKKRTLEARTTTNE